MMRSMVARKTGSLGKSALLAVGLVMVLPACGEDEPGIYIQSFASAAREINKDNTIEVDVKLSQKPAAKTYVDVINDDYKMVLLVTYNQQSNDQIVVVFQPNDDTEKVSVKGIAKGTGTVRFRLRDTSAVQSLTIKVNEITYPDAGPDPDYGAPDASVMEGGTGDTGVMEGGTGDKGTTSDTGTTGDTGTTSDSAASGG